MSLEDLYRGIAASYQMAPMTVETDVRALIEQLLDRELIESTTEPKTTTSHT